MKKMIPLAMLALAFCVVSCAKEPTPAEKAGAAAGAAVDAGAKKVEDATKPK